MGSLNDYGYYRGGDRWDRWGGWKRRLLRQSVLAVLFFFLVAGTVAGDNLLATGSRYVVTSGIAADNSWLTLGGATAVSRDVPTDQTAPVSAASDPAAPTDPTAPADPATPGQGDAVEGLSRPEFTAPASGVVVTELAVSAGGFATEKGVLIQGAAGQTVRAAAAGQVGYLGESADGYILELLHSDGFASVYQGLSQVDVAAGDQVELGQGVGLTASGDVTYSLLLNEQEVDPLTYLFE